MSDGTRIYVSIGSPSNNVTVIDTSTKMIDTTVSVGSDPFAMAISPSGDLVYAANEIDNTVSVIDTSTNMVIATVPAGNDPSGLAVTPDGNFLYITNQTDDTVSIIRTSDNTKLPTTISVGNGPTGIIVSSDGSFVYVANFDDDTISIIKTSDNTVIDTLSAGDSPVFFSRGPEILTTQSKNIHNVFLTQIDIFNELTWTNPALDPGSVSNYKVFRDANLTDLVNTIPVTGPFVIEDHNLSKDSSYTYYIIAEDSNGATIAQAVVTIQT